MWALGVALMACLAAAGQGIDRPAAGRCADLALRCVGQEYPNKLDHVMNGPAEVQPPKTLHPAFYGCFDWHSSVHAHWLLVRVLRLHPDLPQAEEIRRVLDAHLAPEALAAERAYLDQPGRASFERTYGWAWLLKLDAELRTWEDADARRWSAHLRPLAEAFAERLKTFLGKQTYPIRTGVHPNSAYTLSLALDYSAAAGDTALAQRIREKALGWFRQDRRAPLGYEPGGEDFLSPALEEAALMARLLPGGTFRPWLRAFLPGLLRGETLAPAQVSDRNDPKIVHLDGLNLSRAHCLCRLSEALDRGDPARRHLQHLALAHARASLPHIASGSYEGEHWLGTFALRLLELLPADALRP